MHHSRSHTPTHTHHTVTLLQLQAHLPPPEGGAPGSAQPATQAVDISIEFSYVKAIGVVCVKIGVVCVKTNCSTLQVATCQSLTVGYYVSVTSVGYYVSVTMCRLQGMCSDQSNHASLL